MHSLKCERTAGKRDFEQKKHRREESQHNEIGFEVYRLKPELLQAIIDCGFEHPSEGLKIKKKTFNGKLIYSFSSST
jgi:superfamily II DNA/RNA helicase